ncbi:hypothetical protein C0993_009157 [Termitomyces sp. T159_Od127]|nr:hypothetical protein C0993_009157 [Termitomyces sp. T159_Od127]
MSPPYAQVGLPTSATRMNMTSYWGYPPPWPDGTNPQQMSYHQFYLSSHYRTAQATVTQIPPPAVQNPPLNPISAPQPPSTPASGPLKNSTDTSKQSTSIEECTLASAPVAGQAQPESIDSSLNPHESTELTAEQIMQITKALLQDQEGRSNAESNVGSASTTAFSETDGRVGSCERDEISGYCVEVLSLGQWAAF